MSHNQCSAEDAAPFFDFDFVGALEAAVTQLLLLVRSVDRGLLSVLSDFFL